MKEFARRLGVDLRYTEEHFPRGWNIPPGTRHPVFLLNRTGHRTVHGMHWGYRPHWAGEKAREVINARGESAADKPYFRTAFRRGHRCLVPVTAWFEWQKTGSGKQPWALSNEDRLLFLAALYARGEAGHGFAIVTRPVIQELGHIHDRMPLVLSDEDAQSSWLAHEPLPEGWAEQWIVGTQLPEKWECWPVSRKVNQPANDSPDILDRVEPQD